ncbi:MAG: CoA transferase [Dehalococcoidia bacterium]|nr:CoA transferase [Dehalococcoidia bacterium]
MPEPTEPQPLLGLRVIDLTHGIAGPYCTKLLADFGADVIKVERPGSGDWSRALGPFPGDVPHAEMSGLFLHLNTNKRSMVLDLKTPKGVEVVKGLVRDADILVESFRPGVMESLGLGYEVLSKINANLVVTSVSNYGQTGPYRDYLASELTLFATGGKMNATGLPDRYPLKLGGNHLQYQAGNNAAMATLFAWYAERYAGMGGQQVDVSIMETQMASVNSRMSGLLGYQYNGRRGRRTGGQMLGGYPQGYHPTQDGYILLSGGGVYWPRTVALLGVPELLDDPRFAPPLGQLSADGRDEFEATYWLPWLMERTKLQAVAELQAHDIQSGVVNDLGEVVDKNPQLDAREFFVDVEHPVAGRFRYPGSPIYSPRQWWQVRRPAPSLGQHTQEVLKQGWAARQAQEPSPKAAPVARRNGRKRLPLEGLRVLDMTVVWAGPYGTMFLADMGAEVIRVESINIFSTLTRGQTARPDKAVEALRPTSNYPDRDPGPRPWNRCVIFNLHGRNKHSMTVDINTPEGKEVFRRLVEQSDLFVENNGVGSMARLGTTYEVLSQWNPRLIMISTTGFGQFGPWATYRGMGSNFEMPYGHASVMGYPDMDMEGAPSSVATDASTGVTIGIAAIMALHQRERTGKGCYVDISMGECFLPHLGELLMDYTMNGRVAGPSGNRDTHLVQGAYPCSGDDEWVAISIGDLQQWHVLCRLMGQPELIEDERFADWQALQAHHDDADAIIGAWTADKDNLELFHRLQAAGVPVGPVMHEPMAYADPHLKERGFFVEITAPEVGTHQYPTTTFKLSKAPFAVRKPPVRLGEDNDYVYRQVLKLSEAEYDRLKALGQIGMDYAPHIK